ncbi:class IV adenylate cyclase [Patescibacteria group bacterium]|nr:class IV adenylate cyclase [Patescibacteria group bacterium]
MKEIEIKARLRDKEAVKKKLSVLGCVFEKPIRQEDVVYAKKIGSLKDFRSNDFFLRLRTRDDGRVLFTIKKRTANDLDAIEHELEISSKDEMERAILLMGFKEAARLNKVREITNYNGSEVCIDEVERLGSFIEMETLTEEADSVAVQEKMFEFFISLGVKKEDRAMSGYDILMMERNNHGHKL